MGSPRESEPRDVDHAIEADRGDLRAIREGRSEAFAAIMRRHGPGLHRVLVRMLRDEHAAEDQLQETFVKAWKALPRFDASRALHPWLRRIAVNCALDELALRRRRGELTDAEELLSRMHSLEDTESPLRARELGEIVEAAVATLPPDWAAVFRLRVQEELSYAEIADALEIPIGSVMSRLARARARLASALAARLGPAKEVDDARRDR